MEVARLSEWMALEERRRRGERSGPFAVSPWVTSAALAFAAGLAVRLLVQDDRPGQALNLWIAGTALAHLVVVFLAPHRLYWRRDIAVLSHLPIPGEALFGLAARRSLRAAALCSLPLASAALAFVELSPATATRCGVVLGAAFLISGVMAPALALIAGGIVASDKAQVLLGSLGGEFQAPKTSWLGIFPGVAGAGLVLLLIASTPWLDGRAALAAGPLRPLLVAVPALSMTFMLYALRIAPRVGRVATQEVAALDRQRLAHVDRVGPSPLESVVGRSLGSEAQKIYRKDVSLAHRRFPLPYLVGLLCFITAWIIGFAAPQAASSWGIAVLGAAAVYGVIMRRRLAVPPIEYRQLLASLPFSPTDITRAKQRVLLLWLGFYLGIGGAPLIARAANPALVGGFLAGIVAVALVAGRLAAADRS